MKPAIFSIFFVFVLLASTSAQNKPNRHGNADRGGSIRCFAGQKITGQNFNQNFMTLQTCPPESSCNTMNVEATMSVAGHTMTVNIIMGQCAPTSRCGTVTCAQMQQLTIAAQFSSQRVIFGSCSMNCCEDDKCNAELVGESATTDVTAPPPLRPAGNENLAPVSGSAFRCYAGQKVTGGIINIDNQRLQTCNQGSSCNRVDMTVTFEVGSQSITADMSVGQCVPTTAACEAITCEEIQNASRAALLQSLPSVTFGDCSTFCCQSDKCNGPGGSEGPSTTPPGSAISTTAAPTVPEVGTACNPPMWNAEIRDNWPLAGRLKTSKASFQLVVKGVKKGYKAGRTYKILIKSAKKTKSKFNGFMVTLHHEHGNCACPDQECGLGALIGSRRRIAGAPVVQPGCDQPLVMDYPSANANKAQAEWRAPSCGNVIMRALVKGTDGRLYQDNEEDDQEHQILTRILRPKQKKGGRKPKRGRGH